MSISEHFRYRNDVCQSDIFVSDIGITDVDVGYQISPTLRSMSMPTYGHGWVEGVSRQGRWGWGGVSVMAGKNATGECGGRGMLVPVPRYGNIKKYTFFSVVCLILNLEPKIQPAQILFQRVRV
jgi:hypothetical protein